MQIWLQVHPLALAVDGSTGENVGPALGMRLIVGAHDLKFAALIGLPFIPVPAVPRVHEYDEAEERDDDHCEGGERNPNTESAKKNRAHNGSRRIRRTCARCQ